MEKGNLVPNSEEPDQCNTNNTLTQSEMKAHQVEKEPQRVKRSKHILSLGQKADILDRLTAGEGSTSVAKDYNLNESTVRSVKKNEAKIRASLAAGVSKHLKHSFHSQTLRKMEKNLSAWMVKQQSKGITLSMKTIQKKAKIMHNQIRVDGLTTQLNNGKELTFLASKGWFMNFKKRFEQLQITNEQPTQEREANVVVVDYEAAEKFTEDLTRLVKEQGYKPEQVFNVGESQMFWKRLPSKTFLAKQEQQSTGFKPSNDRLSFLLCVNASCDLLAKPMVVYRTQNPKALREKNKHHLPVFWKSNRHAKISDSLFSDWFHNCFVHEVTRYLAEKNLDFKVLLILDDSACHTEHLQFAHPNVEVLFMPPNTSSQLQPLQNGIMHIFKAHYTRHIFQHILTAIKQNYDTAHVTKVWDEYNIADCVRNIKQSLEDMKPVRIRACWKNLWRDVVYKTNFLPSVRNEAKKIVKLSYRIKGTGFDDMQLKEVEAFLKTQNVVQTDSEYEEFLKTCADDNEFEEMEISSKLHQMKESLEKAFQINNQLSKSFFNEDPYMVRSLEFVKELDVILKPYKNMYKLLKSKTDMTTIFFPESKTVEMEIDPDELPLVPRKPMFAESKEFEGNCIFL